MIGTLGLLAAAQLSALTLNDAQRRDVRCVAILAIVAGEQRGGEGASAWPPLAIDGARFAQVVGERTMKETGGSREAVRDAILAAVAAERNAASEPARGEVETCIARMRDVAPPAPAPNLADCAAMVTLASEAARVRGDSDDARRLAARASVLDRRAREALRTKGLGAAEVEREISENRERISAEASARAADGVSRGLDYGPCLADPG